MSNLSYINLDNIGYKTIRLERPWGVRVTPHRMLTLFVIRTGAAWFETDSQILSQVKLNEGSIVGVSAGIGYTFSSALGLPEKKFINSEELFSEKRYQTQPASLTPENTSEIIVGRIVLGKDDISGIYPMVSILTKEDQGRYDRTLKLVNMIADEYGKSEEPSTSAIIKRLSEALSIELIDNVKEKKTLGEDRYWSPSSPNRAITKALDLLHENFQRDWTIESLAKEVGYSRSVFAERFRSVTGVTPMTYLTSLRINRAITLIEEGARPLSEITYLTGYKSEAGFSRAFLREMGVTPGRYRQNTHTDE